MQQRGIEQLRQYGLWFQLLEESGAEILSYGTTDAIQTHYSISELLRFARGKFGSEEETVLIGTHTAQGSEWTYLIGFPVNISIVTMYVNGEHFTNGRSIAMTILISLLFLIVLSGLIYGLWITRKTGRITNSVREIAVRSYLPLPERGAFEDVHRSLNRLDSEIRASDELQAETDRLREEWIANITHDLKTPLSPIKGYAELMADPQSNLEADNIKSYGGAILKNANHKEQKYENS